MHVRCWYALEPVVCLKPAEPQQFAISGETESFGSNNLMGQWLKAIGGYTVEQIGESLALITIVYSLI